MDPLTLEVTSTRSIEGNQYFLLTGFPGRTLLLRKNEVGSLVFYDETEKVEKTWAAFEAATGEAYATGIDSCTSTAVIRTRTGDLKSPLGDFTNGLRIGYTGRCADPGLTTETFLPYVGLAERRMSNIAGEAVYALIYARLGGFTVLAERELTFGITLDQHRYAAGSPMTVRMTLRSTQDRPVRLTFPSGQDYDVVIRNAKGETVYTWSADKAFIAVFRQLEFSGEKNWVVLIPASFPAGDYTATANLATGTKFEASVPFSVEATP